MVRRNRGYKNLGHWESLIALGVVWVCHSLDTPPRLIEVNTAKPTQPTTISSLYRLNKR